MQKYVVIHLKQGIPTYGEILKDWNSTIAFLPTFYKQVNMPPHLQNEADKTLMTNLQFAYDSYNEIIIFKAFEKENNNCQRCMAL